MLFEVGETVVYPHHGAAKIIEVKKRTIRGEEKLYLKLNVTQGDLTIEVPAENVDLVGVRDVIGKEGPWPVGGREADAGEGSPDSDLRARARREDRRREGLHGSRRGSRFLRRRMLRLAFGA